MFKSWIFLIVALFSLAACQTATIRSQASPNAIRPNSTVYLQKQKIRSVENQNIELALSNWFVQNGYKISAAKATADYELAYNTGSVSTNFNHSIPIPVGTRTTGAIGSVPVQISQTGFETRQYQETVTNRTLNIQLTELKGSNAGNIVWESGAGTMQEIITNKPKELVEKILSQLGKTSSIQPIM